MERSNSARALDNEEVRALGHATKCKQCRHTLEQTAFKLRGLVQAEI